MSDKPMESILFADWNDATIVVRVPYTGGPQAEIREVPVTIRQLATLMVEHFTASAFGREDPVSIGTDAASWDMDMLPQTIRVPTPEPKLHSTPAPEVKNW